jgi:hypothetical protein
MSFQPSPDELLLEAVALRAAHGSLAAAAEAGGIPWSTLKSRLQAAAERGLSGYQPVQPGFAIKSISTNEGGAWVKQTKAPGEVYQTPPGQAIKGLSTLVDAEGRTIQQWVKTSQEQLQAQQTIKTMVDELKRELPRISPTHGPVHLNSELLNQFTVTDLHLSMMAWKEETGGDDFDLKIGEKLLIDWFSAAISMSPNAKVAVFAQIGDFLHHDSHESVTPAHRNVLDADSRLQKVIRVSIRVIRQIIGMLLQKHEHVHIIMASGNHDPASSAWLRELLHAMYDQEPRVSVDNSPDIYYVYQHGKTGLFYHHGHKRNIDKVAEVFAGKFREIYGNCLQCFGHVGHYHSDAIVEGNLMKVERHRTLAPADAYSANGGWLSGRDAKVITYHKSFGEVSRQIISPRMLASNDNDARRLAVA